MKTFIRWQGNKSRYIKKIKKFIPNYTGRYIEPFVGSGAMFLYLQPQAWIINDLNKELIHSWSKVKDNAEEIIEKFKELGETFKNADLEKKKLFCKENLASFENSNEINPILYLFLKFCCYRGDILKNNRYIFKGIDYNIYQNNSYSFLKENYYDNLRKVSKYLKNSDGCILNESYTEILKKAEAEDFVFLDPPYFEKHRYQFNYNKNEKIDKDFLYDLKNEVDKLTKKGVYWIMTYADTQEFKDIFKDYSVSKFQVYRQSKNIFVNELIISAPKKN